MIRVRQISIPAGNTVGVLATLGVALQGTFEVRMVGSEYLAVAEDSSGTNALWALQGVHAVRAHNEDVFVKNTAGGSTMVLQVLVTQQ